MKLNPQLIAERPARFVIETIDGRAYMADTAEDAVSMLRGAAWACAKPTDRAYMRAVATRTMLWNKSHIRANGNANDFLEDLQTAGLITIREVH